MVHKPSIGGKTVTIILNPGVQERANFDGIDEPRDRQRTASIVSRGAENVEITYKKWLRAEIVGLAVVIIIVWGLLLLPVIFYHLPDVSLQSYHCINIRDEYSASDNMPSQNTAPTCMIV